MHPPSSHGLQEFHQRTTDLLALITTLRLLQLPGNSRRRQAAAGSVRPREPCGPERKAAAAGSRGCGGHEPL
jgi:hypothetical protein